MDKNMVNIDDLFRQRLSGGEEKDRPAAWLRMSDLLDEKMPVDAGTNWRRMLGYTAGLLLLASATFGGYEAIHGFRGHSAGEGNPTAIAGSNSMAPTANYNHSTTSSNTAPIASNELKNNDLNKSNSSIAKELNAGTSNSELPKHHNTKHNNTIAAAPASTKEIASTNTSSAPVINETPAATSDKKETENKATTTVAVNNVPKEKAYSNTKHHTEKIAKAEKIAPVKPAVLASGSTPAVKTASAAKTVAVAKPAIVKTTVKHSAPLASNVRSRQNASAIPVTSTTIVPAATVSTVATPATVPAQMPKEEMTKLNVRQIISVNPRNQTAIVHFDTISRDKLMVSADAQSPLLASNEAPKQLMPASSASGSDMSAAANTEKKSSLAKGNTKNNAWSMDHFRSMIDNFKYNFKHIEMQPGVTAGINATFFGGSDLKGFQLGLTDNLLINDNWSFLSELKYFNRINSSTISDDYITYTPAVTGYFKNLNARSYTFTSVQSLELPLTLRYSRHHFIISGGANIVYNFAINDNLVQAYYPTQTLVAEPGADTQPKYNTAAFGSRWGLGYVLGLGYEVMPGLDVDFRMTKTFVDNANTPAMMSISNTYYNMPSMQLSIGYHLVREHKMIRR